MAKVFKNEVIGLVIFRMESTMSVQKCGESSLFLKVIERALEDVVTKADADRKYKKSAVYYLGGPLFKLHVGLLGLDYEWSIELINKLMKAFKKPPIEVRHDEQLFSYVANSRLIDGVGDIQSENDAPYFRSTSRRMAV